MFSCTNTSKFVMTARVTDILTTLNNLAPFHLAETWDNVGLLVGNADQEVTAVLAGLDPTNNLLDEAIALGANTVVTHHPVIFKPLPTIDTRTPEGRLLEKALTHRIALIGCHTNFDSAETGVSTILAEALGLDKRSPLLPTNPEIPAGTGLGCIGSYPDALSKDEFLRRLFAVLGQDSLQMAGILPAQITSVAICGGSGSEFAVRARALGAEVYLSAEIKHNTAIWALESNFCIIDGGHYPTEKPAVAFLVKKLEEANRLENWNIRIIETTTELNPFVKLTGSNPQ